MELLAQFPPDFAPDKVPDRLAYLVAWATRMASRHGSLPVFYDRDMNPSGEKVNRGYELQMGHRLPAARAWLTGTASWEIPEQTFTEHALAQVGPNGAIVGIDGREEWWIQAERLRSAITALELGAGDFDAAVRAWEVVDRLYIDRIHGGFRPVPRFVRNRAAKGGVWKDASHEAFALAAALEHLT